MALAEGGTSRALPREGIAKYRSMISSRDEARGKREEVSPPKA